MRVMQSQRMQQRQKSLLLSRIVACNYIDLRLSRSNSLLVPMRIAELALEEPECSFVPELARN